MSVIKVSKKISLPEKELSIQFNANFDKGKTLGLVGPSGSGKTTILRMICGLVKPDHGRIIINDEIWFDLEEHIDLPVRKRSVGIVFQQYLLFPNMSVKENLSFATNSKEKLKDIEEVLDLVDLRSELNRMPSHLSGGQQQRVALARALIRKPKILLLDEPLSALDHELRIKLQDDLKILLSRINIPVILVSHDPREIGKLTDKIFSTELNDTFHSEYEEKIFEVVEIKENEGTVLLSTSDNIQFYIPIDGLPVKGIKPGMKFSMSTS